MKWQPIGTAPEDSTAIVDLWCAHDGVAYRVPDCHRRLIGDGWIDDHGNIIQDAWITHWMPLPEPPKAHEQAASGQRRAT